MTTDISLVEELNLAKNQADPHAPFFTGWKSCDPQSWNTDATPDDSLGYCGQIVQWIGGDHGAYVNLPGGESGVILAGNTFEIGTERIYASPSLDDMREMLLSGLKKLKEVVEEYKKGEPCPTAQTS